MKPSEVITQASELSGEQYKVPVWLAWMNMAQSELEKVALIPKTVVIPLTKGVNEYDIPASLSEVGRIAIQRSASYKETLGRLQVADFNSEGYHIEDGQIILQHVDFETNNEMLVVGFKKLGRFTEEGLDKEIPDIPESVHVLYVHYLVTRAAQKEEWQAQQQWSHSEWLAGKEEFENGQRSQLTSFPTRIKIRGYY